MEATDNENNHSVSASVKVDPNLILSARGKAQPKSTDQKKELPPEESFIYESEYVSEIENKDEVNE